MYALNVFILCINLIVCIFGRVFHTNKILPVSDLAIGSDTIFGKTTQILV